MALTNDTPLQFLKGVGPKLGAILRKKGLHRVEDLLNFYPRTYEDRRQARNIASLQEGELVSLKTQLLKKRSYALGKTRRRAYELILKDSTGIICCKFFRVPYRGYFDKFQEQMLLSVTGKVLRYRGQLEFHHPEIREYEDIAEGELPKGDSLIPIYIEAEGLSSKRWEKLVGKVLEAIKNKDFKSYKETFPKWLMEKYDLKPRQEAIVSLHSPPEGAGSEFIDQQSPYHRRIIFEEFFWLELYLAARRQGVKSERSAIIKGTCRLTSPFLKKLPFELTQGQKKAFGQIQKDMASGYPMHRMVQGDVGSGKTIVALLASLVAVESGYQVAIMAPTEILAQQHAGHFENWLGPLGVRVALLSGSMKAKNKSSVLEALQAGQIDIVLGTHALIQRGVHFSKLGLVVVDEQHRFGVEQRTQLKKKGTSPHLLLMTATPIPRSLAMTVYGDLDVSLIKEMPKGRQPILTRVTSLSRRDKVLKFVDEQIEKGRQAYVVFPLVEESEKLDLASAMTEFTKLKKEWPHRRLGLIHGRMKADEKDQVMLAFRAGEYDILVSTTVIEVGVDVPNSNIIWINNAERFGLSQLHQLRGRVGRGTHKSYCILMTGFAVSRESRERLAILESSTDGFEISEADLELRGPGEFMGARQSGLTGFKMAHLVRDIEILNQAREAAFELVSRDQYFKNREHQEVKRKFSQLEIIG